MGKPPNQLDIDMVHVMDMELEAYAASLKNKKKEAANWFEKASQLDEGLKYSYGPPIILKPVDEAYGEWLLESDKPDLAISVFEKSLKRYPGRLLSLKGKKRAAELLKKEDVMAAVAKVLEVNLAKEERDLIL